MTVRDLATRAIAPEGIKVLIGVEEYELISEYSAKINTQMLEMLGDYVVEDYKANEPNHYTIWVLMRPVKVGEV